VGSPPQGYAARTAVVSLVSNRPQKRAWPVVRFGVGARRPGEELGLSKAANTRKNILAEAAAAIRERGRAEWYDWYELVVAEVTRAYDWKRPG